MISVDARFHDLATGNNPTRIRIYFFADSVNFTNDADVVANGELLVRDAGDTDSNKRIAQDGISLTRYYNRETDYKIGDTVSNVLSVTFMNDDGGLDNFDFSRRCKVFLDVQDPANGTWYNCPLGIFRFEKPVKQRVQLIHAIAYDIMQELNVIADSWWNNLDFSGGITIGGLCQQIAAVIDTSMTFGLISNSSVSYTSRPFTAVEMTYRDILALLAEAMSVNIRLAANGIMRAASWSTVSHTIDCDAVGNGVISFDMAEYTVPVIDRLRVLATESSNSADIGTGENVYDIVENPFLFAPNVTTKATAIYNRIHAFVPYKPISARIIGDWSIEPGDGISIKYQGTTYYNVPIFQQTITWHGGLVYIDFFCTGSASRPVMSKMGRAEFRDAKTVHTIENTADTLASRINDFDGSGSTIEQTVDSISTEVASKVGDNEIISKINQSPEQITIQANKLSLLGYTTINDGFKVNLDGTFEANGATINGSLKTKSGTKSVEMTSGMLQFVRSGDTLFSMDYDSDLGGISLNANTNNGVRQVRITGAGGPSSGIQLYDTDGTTIIGEMTCSGILQVGTSTGNKLTYGPANGLTSDGGATIVGNTTVFGDISATGNITSNGTITAGNLSVNNDLTADTATVRSATVSGDATIRGVLDVTTRRCYASLSSAGWYRVCTCNNTNLLYTGGIVKFRIILYANGGSENHEITLSCTTGNGAVWKDESSNGNANISNIRLTKETGNVYHVDIYYQSSVERSVDVFFEPYFYNQYLNRFTAESLQSVADAPSGETILTTYDFSADLSPTYLKYVDSEAATYTVGSNHYVAVPYPSGLNGQNVVSIAMASWTSVTGAISIMPYGNADASWYIIGEAGVTLTNVVFRYWYI